MALIDVTSNLVDPDFVDAMSVITRVPTTNLLGENLITESILNSVGSIQPATGKAIQRIPELLRVANMSSFWFKGTIVATAPGEYPNILVFRGYRYQVKNVFDWTNWGAGWSEGLCVAEVPAP